MVLFGVWDCWVTKRGTNKRRYCFLSLSPIEVTFKYNQNAAVNVCEWNLNHLYLITAFPQWLENIFSGRISLLQGSDGTSVLWSPDGRWYCGFCSVQGCCRLPGDWHNLLCSGAGIHIIYSNVGVSGNLAYIEYLLLYSADRCFSIEACMILHILPYVWLNTPVKHWLI